VPPGNYKKVGRRATRKTPYFQKAGGGDVPNERALDPEKLGEKPGPLKLFRSQGGGQTLGKRSAYHRDQEKKRKYEGGLE